VIYASMYINDKNIHEFVSLMKKYYYRSAEVIKAHDAEDIDID